MRHTILLADNQDITRYGLWYILKTYPDKSIEFNIIEVHTRAELVGQLKAIPDAITIIDYSLFDMSNTDDFLYIISRFSDARWVVFSEDLNETFIRRFAQEPNVSMLYKDCKGSELELAITYSLNGNTFHGQNVTAVLLSTHTMQEAVHGKLTATEIEILKLIAQGKSVKEIAAIRFSSIHTITTHKKNIFRKLSVNTVYEATRYAFKTGIAEMVEYYI